MFSFSLLSTTALSSTRKSFSTSSKVIDILQVLALFLRLFASNCGTFCIASASFDQRLGEFQSTSHVALVFLSSATLPTSFYLVDGPSPGVHSSHRIAFVLRPTHVFNGTARQASALRHEPTNTAFFNAPNTSFRLREMRTPRSIRTTPGPLVGGLPPRA